MVQLAALLKMAADQPRDDHGRWSSGGSVSDVTSTDRSALITASKELTGPANALYELRAALYRRGDSKVKAVVADGKPVAAIAYETLKNGNLYVQELGSLGGGAGGALLDAVEQEAHSAGKAVQLDAVSSAVAYYEKRGYVVSGKPKRGTDTLPMKLAPPAKKIYLSQLLRKSVDAAAHAASTSDLNLLRKPTEAQARAGNYRKGHARVCGLGVSLENPAGSRRRPEWPPLPYHYGYAKRTEGADGDQLDVCVRPGTPEEWAGTVYVVDQFKVTGLFDEHKCLVGYDSREDAVRAYLAAYPSGWTLGPVTGISAQAFRSWALRGDLSKPLSKSVTKTDWGLAKLYSLIRPDPVMELTERLLAVLVELKALRKYNPYHVPGGTPEGGQFGFGDGSGAGAGSTKPTTVSAKGVKAGVHELLSSGHPFTFAELKAATGVTTDKHLSSALSELKNPKWAGPKGALAIEKSGDHYYVKAANEALAAKTGAAPPPPAAAPPVAAPPPASVAEKPVAGLAKAPAAKLSTGAADKAYYKTVQGSAATIGAALKSGALTQTEAAQAFKDAKALAMAQWKADTSGVDQQAAAQQVFKSDLKLATALADANGNLDLVNVAISTWKADTAAEKAGTFGAKPAVGFAPGMTEAAAAAKEQAAAQAVATQQLGSALPTTALTGIPQHDDLVPAGFQPVAASDFGTGKGSFAKEMSALKSTLQYDAGGKENTAVQNKIDVQSRITKELAAQGSPNLDAIAKAAGLTPSGLVQRLVATWAGSSGDSNALSVSVQLAVRDTFGMKAADLEMKALATLKDHTEDEALRMAGSQLGLSNTVSTGAIKAALQEFVAAQYRSTQAYFKENGITEVSVVRGMKVGMSSEPASHVDLKLQPASSFSANFGTAKGFAGGRTLFASKVPATQVLGTYRTGFGCSNEHEVVVLAHSSLKAIAMGTSHAEMMGSGMAGFSAGAKLAAPIGKALGLLLKRFALSPDATLDGADWTKTTWDLPPLGSKEFLELGIPQDKFRATPAYAHAEAGGLVHDDEWVADWVKPAGKVRLRPKEKR